VLALVVASVVLALLRWRWRDPGFAVPGLVLLSGIGAQVLLAQGERLDALLLWLVPAYALAAWAVVQVAELVSRAVSGRAVAPTVAIAAIAVVGTVGIVDLNDSVDDVPLDRRLSAAWEAARADEPVQFNPLGDEGSEHWNYLPCDPPYDWGSQIWYLREVLEEGRGLQEAVETGAFERREGSPCERA
jgi:hypothetical protein